MRSSPIATSSATPLAAGEGTSAAASRPRSHGPKPGTGESVTKVRSSGDWRESAAATCLISAGRAARRAAPRMATRSSRSTRPSAAARRRRRRRRPKGCGRRAAAGGGAPGPGGGGARTSRRARGTASASATCTKTSGSPSMHGWVNAKICRRGAASRARRSPQPPNVWTRSSSISRPRSAAGVACQSRRCSESSPVSNQRDSCRRSEPSSASSRGRSPALTSALAASAVAGTPPPPPSSAPSRSARSPTRKRRLVVLLRQTVKERLVRRRQRRAQRRLRAEARGVVGGVDAVERRRRARHRVAVDVEMRREHREEADAAGRLRARRACAARRRRAATSTSSPTGARATERTSARTRASSWRLIRTRRAVRKAPREDCAAPAGSTRRRLGLRGRAKAGLARCLDRVRLHGRRRRRRGPRRT